MIFVFALSAGVACLGFGGYGLWLWFHDWQPITLGLAFGSLSIGALNLFAAWLWRPLDDWSASGRRLGIEDPSKALEGAGWEQERRR